MGHHRFSKIVWKGHTFVLKARMTALSLHFEDVLNNRFLEERAILP